MPITSASGPSPVSELRAVRALFDVSTVVDELSVSIKCSGKKRSCDNGPSFAEWVGRLRRVGAYRLSSCGLSFLVDDAQLLISELVTNGFEHGSGHRIVFRLVVTTDVVVIEVDDGSPNRPEVRTAGDLEESGRGMLLVSALADSWGISPDGTRTWCTLAVPAPAPTRPRSRACLERTPKPP
ncbi:ATP-binding protein [Actinacidiphila sp. bgisy144]|uniref:ATP-binding protein n=1 Tax=unclassified Actinacidiphila TaxID=2995708 RepID=UPI003EBC275D